MHIDKILLPYDFSEPAHRALLEAREYLKTNAGIELHILHINVGAEDQYLMHLDHNPFGVGSKFTLADIRELQQQEVDHELSLLHERIDSELIGLEDRIHIKLMFATSPAEKIIEYAKEHQCDLIIMGARGLGALRGVLGSVSYGVLRGAPMPVLIVK